MRLKNLALYSLCGVSAIILSGCAFAGGLTKEEKAMVSDLTPSNFQPATRDSRDSIETQDNFAQAAFWSREYQLNPSDLESAIKLSAAVRRMGNPGKAVEIAQTSRAMHPTDPYLTAEYAAALIASSRADEAMEALDGGLRRAPGYARLWSLKGAALDQAENYQLAQRHYNRALQITPQDPNIMANMGLSYALAGDPARAESWLQRAASMPGASAGIRQNLSLVQQLQGKEPAPAQSAQAPQKQTQRTASNHNTPTASSRQSYMPQSYTAPSRQNSQPRTYGGSQPSAQRQQTRQNQAYSPQRNNYRQPAQSRTPQYNSAASGYTSQKPQSQTPGQSAPSSFGHRSNFTVVGQESGAPKTAADAARAAARNRTSRKMVVPAGQPVPTGNNTNILNQIARNVGPQRNAQTTATRSNQSRTAQTQTSAGQQYYSQNTAPAAQNNYPASPYAGGYGPKAETQSQRTPRRRGAARRR